ncbi:MAG: hypothetical protein ACI97A_000224 [Planctomycetota bacterium]|jgi:hypothetical protein
MCYAAAMKYPRLLSYLALSLLVVLSACASKPMAAKKIVTVESREPLNVNDGGGSISIRVKGKSTILMIDDRRFVCQDYSGYIGQVNGSKGWVHVGKLDFTYDPEKIFIRGRKRWQTFSRRGELSYFVAQDGTTGRSVFKD